MILTVHVVVIGGMLLQGCKDTSTKDPANNNNPLSDSSSVVANPANTPGGPSPTVDVPPPLNPGVNNTVSGPAVTPIPVPLPTQPMAAESPKTPEALPVSATGEKEYVIVSGDRLAAIAHKNGITLKALMDANPGINATKLQINQKIQIPAGIAGVTTPHGTGAAPVPGIDSTAADSAFYTVKPGDMLLKIAKSHGTSVKKIMAMNDLKTTSIRAGQKLKLPASNAAPSAPTTGPAGGAVPSATASVTRVSGATSPVAAN
jgi:peptidoglycan endopeptidase LytE